MVEHKCTPSHTERRFYTEVLLRVPYQKSCMPSTCTPVGTQRGDAFRRSSLLIPPVMMAYRSSVHESTGFSPYRLMFGEECTLPMDIGLPHSHPEPAEHVTSPYAVWVKDLLEVAFDQVRQHSGQAVRRQTRLYDQRAVRRLFALGDWVMRYYPAG